jgi:hypothetical protein
MRDILETDSGRSTYQPNGLTLVSLGFTIACEVYVPPISTIARELRLLADVQNEFLSSGLEKLGT